MTEASSNRPYLSVVVAVRNDNYGGDFNKRLQNFINWNTALFEKYKINTEILLVNWNPIPTNQPLTEMVTWPKNREYVRYKIVEVPNATHDSFIDDKVRKTVPVIEFIAKNVGIKRANGQFILCTNADILLSEKVVREISENKLDTEKLYRSVRMDFVAPSSLKLTEASISANITSAFLRTGSVKMTGSVSFSKALFLAKSVDNCRKWFITIWLKIVARYDFHVERIFLFEFLFNASGDFALLSKAKWHTGCHYHEDMWISTHTDSMHILTCLSQAIDVVEMEGFVFHQEHSRRYDFSSSNPDMDYMFERLLAETRGLFKGNFNLPDKNWGLNELTLESQEF